MQGRPLGHDAVRRKPFPAQLVKIGGVKVRRRGQMGMHGFEGDDVVRPRRTQEMVPAIVLNDMNFRVARSVVVDAGKYVGRGDDRR